MNKAPLVSVFLQTYNHQTYINESINSILQQDYENIEIIIGDDCSTDSNWQIIQQYQTNFPEKIRAFRNPVNMGITATSNEILKLCTGKYIATISGDDVCLPGKISRQVEVMESDQSVVLCSHDWEKFNSVGNETIGYGHHGTGSSSPIAGTADKVARKMATGCYLAALTVMVRRDAIPVTGFDQRVPVASDWLMWVEILAMGGKNKKVKYIPNVLARYRRHSSNVTGIGFKHISDIFVTLAIIESKYPFLANSVRIGYARVRYDLALALIEQKMFKDGRGLLLLSLLTGWVSWRIFYWLAVSYIPFLLQFPLKLRTHA